MTKKLKYYGGQGYSGVNEVGLFAVKTDNSKTFTKLSDAREYYNNLTSDKALWDMTKGAELIECHTIF